ncbi:hypothetical protein [Mammaliicoccus sciuri]|uniref:hypothetical protein n=1 Tax=Mammaliicoccus sciuri TaxID=1296 RepID=UPI0036DE21FD
MEYILSLVIIPILFLIHIIMSGILIKNQQRQIERLYRDLEKQYLERYKQVQLMKEIKQEADTHEGS